MIFRGAELPVSSIGVENVEHDWEGKRTTTKTKLLLSLGECPRVEVLQIDTFR